MMNGTLIRTFLRGTFEEQWTEEKNISRDMLGFQWSDRTGCKVMNVNFAEDQALTSTGFTTVKCGMS